MKPTDWPLPDDVTLGAVKAEVVRARTLFPNREHLMAALVEEVGELAKSFLNHGAESEQVEREAIQVAAVAVRIVEEGDPAFVRQHAPRNAKTERSS